MNILSDLIITKIYSVMDIYTENGIRGKRTNRERWGIIIKYEGETVYTSKGAYYISNINNIAVLPKGCSYEWQCTDAGHFKVVEFESEMEYNGIFTIHVKDSEKILNLFKKMEYMYTVKTVNYKLENIRDAYSVLLNLAQSAKNKYQPSEKYRKISPAVEYIAKYYNTGITNEKLASLTGLSVVYFRKLFTEYFGTSPIAYVQELRIKKAKEMLESDYGSISDIAESLGYQNIYDFSRVFKKFVGISPSKYKKQAEPALMSHSEFIQT